MGFHDDFHAVERWDFMLASVSGDFLAMKDADFPIANCKRLPKDISWKKNQDFTMVTGVAQGEIYRKP